MFVIDNTENNTVANRAPTASTLNATAGGTTAYAYGVRGRGQKPAYVSAGSAYGVYGEVDDDTNTFITEFIPKAP